MRRAERKTRARRLAAVICAVLGLLAALPAPAGRAEGAEAAKVPGFDIRDGIAQPVYTCTDPRRPGYVNAGSDILRFVVYVETDYDTDLDGKPDLIKVMVQVPRAAAQGRFAVPAVFEARPYIAGMYGYNPDLPPVGAADFDEACLRTRPAKRVPAGVTDSLALAETADPADWNYQLENDPFGQQYLGNLTAYDDLLVRGFAVVQAAGLGTWGSEGIQCCATDLEAAAFRCVVEWLTGRRSAFTDRTGGILIPADWCSGRVGMTGRSYAGTMAFEVASTGVEGLVTVVPVAGIASWYDYANSQGIPSGLLAEYDSVAGLSVLCASRFFAPVDSALQAHFERYLAWQRDRQIELAGDYGPFWAARDFTGGDFKASALIVQGLRDDQVHPKQFDLMRNAFLRSGCRVTCLLHQNGHITPADEQAGTDILIGGHTFTEWLNLWFTHELLGVENEASALPNLMVQSNVDGAFYGTDQWNTGRTLRLGPGDALTHTVSAEGAHMNNAVLLNEVFDGTSGDDHLLWAVEAAEPVTICGAVAVHLRVRTEETGSGLPMLGAVLTERADEAFPCFDTGAVGVLDREVLAEGGVDRGPGAAPYDLVAWRQTERTGNIIAYGAMDLRNPGAGCDPASAVPAAEAQPGTWHDVTLWLQPAWHTVRAGHRLELYIVPFCGFSGEPALIDTLTPEELRAMGLDPETLAPFVRDYRFTVDNSRSWAELPVPEEGAVPVPLAGEAR